MSTQLRPGSTYSFTTINPAILGSAFSKVRVTGNLEYTTAKIIEPNIDSLQAALVPYLPENASTKHTAYQYFVIETQTKAVKVFAAEWINSDSVVEDTVKQIDIRITGADSSNLPEIKSVLGLAGFPVVNEIV